MRLEIGCAYCRAPVVLKVGDLKTPEREATLFTYKCPSCDSVVELGIESKRKRGGKRWKQGEATKKAEHDATVLAAQKRNAEIAERLLAQPGCTCLAHHERSVANGYSGFTRNDHWLVSSWTYGIPNAPYHKHGCPCRNTDEEASIRAGVLGVGMGAV